MKDKISKEIQNSLDVEHKKATQKEIIDYFVKKTKVDAPTSMIENYLFHVIEDIKSKNNNNQSIDEENLKNAYKDTAESSVKWYLIKEHILNVAEINVSNDDYENRKKELIEKDPQNAKSIKVFLKDSNNQQKFVDDILNEKLFEYLKQYAIIKIDEKKSDELRKMQGASQ